MNRPDPITRPKEGRTVKTWPATEPPHALRWLLHRLANPPLTEVEEEFSRLWDEACRKIAEKDAK